MAKFNTFATVTPTLTDKVLGTDVSDTSPDANGDSVQFTLQAIMDLIESNGSAPAGFITSGTLADARIAETNVTQHEAALSVTESQISDLGTYIGAATTDTLTNKTIDTASNTLTIAAADVGSGTFVDARVAETNVTQHEAALSITESQVSDLGTYIEAATTDTLTNKTIDTASNTITVAASDIGSGTLADARIAETNVTQHEAALSVTESQVSDLGSYLTSLAGDTTPQLGGDLDVNGNDLVSTSNGDITLAPNGTGNVVLGNFTINADATVGAGQDDYVLSYDHSAGTWGPSAVILESEVDTDIKTLSLPASTTISTYGATLVDDADAATARATLGIEDFIVIAVSDEATALTTGTAKVTFRMPYAFTLTEVRASVTTAPTGDDLTVDINDSGVSVLSTKLTIDAGEKTSASAATPAVISDSALADDAEVTIDIDGIGSTVAGTGLKVTLLGTKT